VITKKREQQKNIYITVSGLEQRFENKVSCEQEEMKERKN